MFLSEEPAAALDVSSSLPKVPGIIPQWEKEFSKAGVYTAEIKQGLYRTMINRERAIYWMSLTGLNFTPSPLTAPVDGPMGWINYNGITYDLVYSFDDSGRYVTVQYLTSSYLNRDIDTIEYYVNRSRRGNAKCERFDENYMAFTSTFRLTDKFHIEEQTLQALSELELMYKALKEVYEQLYIDIELYVESLGNCK